MLKSGILRFLASGTHPSWGTLTFRGELLYHDIEKCVLEKIVLGVPSGEYQMVDSTGDRKSLFLMVGQKL